MIMMKIIVEVKSSMQKEFLQAIRSLKCSRKKQKGLRKLSFYQEIDHPDSFTLIYEWDAQEDMDGYMGEEEFRVLIGALKVLGENSDISFMHTSNECDGLISQKDNTDT